MARRNIHKSEEEKQTCRKEKNSLAGGKDGKVFGFEDKNRKVVDYSQNTEVKKPECGEIDGIGRC